MLCFRRKVEDTEVNWEQIEHAVAFYFDGKSYYVPLGTRHLMLMESIEEVSEVDDIESTEAAVLSNIGSEENISDLVV